MYDTYRTIYTVRPRLGAIPEVPKPQHPGMSWAELAAKEGHRKGLPAPIQGERSFTKRELEAQETDRNVLKAIGENRASASVIASLLGVSAVTVRTSVKRLRHHGHKIVSVQDGGSNWYELEAGQ